MLRADSYPIGTRFEQNPNSATRLFGTLVGYSKQGPDMAIIEWDHGLNITVTPISELKHCPENDMDSLAVYKSKHPKDKLYEVVLTVPYYAYADSVEEAISYAEEAQEANNGFFVGTKAKLLKSPKDASYRKHFKDLDYVFNSECFPLELGEAFHDLKIVNKRKSVGKGSGKGASKRDQLYHAAEEHGGKASVLLSSEPKKNTKSKKVTKSKKKRPVTSKKR